MRPGAGQCRRYSRAEYDRMIAAGVFNSEDRLQLIDGEIVTMTPQGSRHATAVQLTEELLRNAFPPSAGYSIRIQMPLALDERSEPEPDVAVVYGSPRDYRDLHPTAALLIIEVSDTTLSLERDRKMRLYARSGIAEYWILNLDEARLEVYREPAGEAYKTRRDYGPDATVQPLAAPSSAIAVSSLLP